jgi:outer membrane protein, heavy metal efflux system
MNCRNFAVCTRRLWWVGAAGLLVLPGCATRHYQAAPISAAASAAALETRSLTDPGLLGFLQKHSSRAPNTWAPAALTLAAIYYSPDLRIARASLKNAEAVVITAGARPNPSFGVGPGYSSSPESPLFLESSLNFPIETAGKRGYRILQATREAESARLQLAEQGWQVGVRVRSALLALLIAERNLALTKQEQETRREFVRLTEAQVDAGELPSPELTAARIDLTNTTLQAHLGEGQLRQARADLASAIGVPEPTLDGVQVSWPELEHPPSEQAVSAQNIQRTAVLHRLDLQMLLADYAAAEAALRLEVAKQYPDIQLGPGYTFEEGHNNYLLGLAVDLPILNKNRGPIAQAEAQRERVAAQFSALQLQVIGQSRSALAAYKYALAQLAAADRLVQEQAERERLARRSFDLGESDKLTLSGVLLQTTTTARARLDALNRARTALGDLENAVQQPLEPEWQVPLLPTSGNAGIELLREQPK